MTWWFSCDNGVIAVPGRNCRIFLEVYAREWCACRLGWKHPPPAYTDVGKAVLHSSCVTGAGGVVTYLLWHLSINTHCCSENFSLGKLEQIGSLVSIRSEGIGKEARNPPSSSSISNSSYRPEAWRLNGGGEKGLNEQWERYLQLPPLTWATTAAIGRHPRTGTPLFISARWPTVKGRQPSRAKWKTGNLLLLNCNVQENLMWDKALR